MGHHKKAAVLCPKRFQSACPFPRNGGNSQEAVVWLTLNSLLCVDGEKRIFDSTPKGGLVLIAQAWPGWVCKRAWVVISCSSVRIWMLNLISFVHGLSTGDSTKVATYFFPWRETRRGRVMSRQDMNTLHLEVRGDRLGFYTIPCPAPESVVPQSPIQ